MILSHEGNKNIFQKWPSKKKKILPPFVIPTVQNLSMCQVPKKMSYIKNAAIQKTVSKMTVGTGSWRPAVENAIPCVEIEQR